MVELKCLRCGYVTNEKKMMFRYFIIPKFMGGDGNSIPLCRKCYIHILEILPKILDGFIPSRRKIFAQNTVEKFTRSWLNEKNDNKPTTKRRV